MTGVRAGPFSFSRAFSGWWWLLQRDLVRLMPVLIVWLGVTFAALSADYAFGLTSGIGLLSLTYLTDPLFTGICYWIVLSDKRANLAEALQLSAGRYLALLAVSIIGSVGVGLGLLLLIIPGIALAVFWSVATPVLLSEQVGPIAALRKSFEYTKSRFWPLLGLCVIYWIATLALFSVLFALNLGSLDGEPGIGLAFESVSEIIISVVSVFLIVSIYREIHFTGHHDLSAFD